MAKQQLQRKSKSKKQDAFKRSVEGATGEFFDYTYATASNFYGIKVANTIDDFVNFDQNTSSTPEIIINGTSAVIDYSSCQAEKDKNYIKVAFESLVSGNTFNITNGSYYDPNTERYADISGTYTFENLFSEYVISATFDTLDNTPTGMVRYSSDYFSDVPQFDMLGTAASNEEQSFLKNYLGPNSIPSFSGLGVRKNDYIRIADSTLNSGAFRVDDMYLDPNGTEVLILGATAAKEEDRIGSTSEIKLYKNQFRYVPDDNGVDPNIGLGLQANFETTYVHVQSLKITVGVENDLYFYKINGDRQPKLKLERGVMYIFDQTHPSNYRGPNNVNLPMRLASVRDGTFNKGAQYRGSNSIFVTTGVFYPRSEANVFMFEPRFLESNTLYYYCGNRQEMGGEIKLQGTYAIRDRMTVGPASVPPLYVPGQSELDYALKAANRVSASYGDSSRDINAQSVFERINRSY